MLLIKNAFMCVFAGYRCVFATSRTFTASTRVARSTQYAEFTPFAPTCGLRYDVVGSKFTRTGNPVRRPFVAFTFQPIPIDMSLDEFLASGDSFAGYVFPFSHTF